MKFFEIYGSDVTTDSGIKSIESSGGIFRVRLISPGQGSSGFYSRELLEEYIPGALPIGTALYYDHTDGDDEFVRDGTRSSKDAIGYIETTPRWEGDGMYANVRFVKRVSEDLDVLKNTLGLSIEVHSGKKDAENNILELHYTEWNSVALVPVPGRDGRIISRIYESLRLPNEEEREVQESDKKMTEEQFKALMEASVKTQTALEAIAQSFQEAFAKPEEKTKEINAVELATKLAGSGLNEIQLGIVATAVESGVPVDDAIKVQKDLAEAILESRKGDEDGVRFSESGSNNYEDAYKRARGWKVN